MAKHLRDDPVHIPSSTYRLQMNRHFTFRQAMELVEYLHALGIGDCYLSPFLMAAPGSLHGYDVTDPSRINPEVGTREDLERFSRSLKQRGMGILADVVPNHMCIDDAANQWWWDVLENGPSSPYARYFDINWNPPKRDLVNRVLLPILGDQYGRILEDQQIAVIYDRGGLLATVYQKPLPLAPRSWALVLQPAADALKRRLGESHEHVLELESILTALSHLPSANESDPTKIHEGQREKEVIRKRLAALVEASPPARKEIDTALRWVNGVKGVPHSFDLLEELLAQQSYRLSFWKVAADEINYRRFFDINRLAAIRVEDPEVFQAVHALIFDLVKEGRIDGLRVDHSDGLRDPAEYFRRLQAACTAAGQSPGRFYVVTEKIVTGDEKLRPDWDIEGSTGYDFLSLLNGLFVDRSHRRAFHHLYDSFTGSSPSVEDLAYASKRLILQTSMSGELFVLAEKLDKISEEHRWSRDFTLSSLRHVLRETIACFPIYRTYITDQVARPDPEDERYIRSAIARAKRRNQSTDESIFDFLQHLLLLEDPEGIDDAQRAERRQFIMSLQQFTGPVMAKGIEDTAFYRYFPLSSLNEVGGDPRQFGTSPAVFHARNQERWQSWPNALLASSTHDSKRSEDVRARINVLSEIPAEWYRALCWWRVLNAGHKEEVAGSAVPSAAEEYLFYQTLVGAWPLREPDAAGHEEFIGRMAAYMRKALREAKIDSSWINPNLPHEEAVERFVRGVLEPIPGNAFLRECSAFVQRIKGAGMWNSLSQTLLKIASPGVPDFYQGSEIWDFSLVDPDNRRPVDYALRKQLLDKLREEQAHGAAARLEEVTRDPADGRVKLYVTSRALCFRKSNRDLFTKGSYIRLRAIGQQQNHAIAFGRVLGRQAAIAAVGRFFMGLGAEKATPTGEAAWGDSALLLRHDVSRGPGRQTWREVFSQTTIQTVQRSGKHMLPLAEVFAHLPVALLESVE
ncbi:MAG TPA: malto-oligosyltrehalose synthase [Bryobacteraceae bacterium]|nr:malto-oligosyltrehalose synthase [Bryobacteraceae bacterium]